LIHALEIVCVSSVEELEKLSGITGITDIHQDKIEHITIPSKQGKGDLKWI
jgi:isoleucyl-tRNA synthetase